MSKIKFKNEYFLSEELDDGSIIITILKDDRNFYNINLEGCQFVTDKNGFISNHFTTNVNNKISNYCKKNDSDIFTIGEELRNRMLNILISMIV